MTSRTMEFLSQELSLTGVSAAIHRKDLMQNQKLKAVDGLTKGIEGLLKKNKVDYTKGWGKFKSANEIEVDLNDGGKELIKAKNVILATGSEPSPIPGGCMEIDEQTIVSSTGALALKSVPKKMIVIGGGVIGLEMSSIYSRLGTQIDVVEFMPHICPTLDKEISTAFQRSLKKQGINFHLKAKVVAGKKTSSGVTITVEDAAGGNSREMSADIVLIATGRRAFTQGLGLENLGLQLDKMGKVPIKEHFQTNIPGIYAIGDLVSGPMLAHKAEEEGIACVEHIVGEGGHINYDCIPGVIYTFPEVASLGKTEEELKEAGIEYRKGSFPFMANSRARTNDSAEGLVKVLSDKKTDRVLGIHIIGPNAGEMIAEGVLAMEYGASSEDIARTCHAHPTLSEAFKEAAMAVYDKSIHF